MVMIDVAFQPLFRQTKSLIPHTVTKFSVETAFLGRFCGRRGIGHTCDFMCICVQSADSGGVAALRRASTAARLLGLRVRIPPVAWMSVSCECCVLSGRGLCDELITRPEESYRV